jgi:hypothetical protein
VENCQVGVFLSDISAAEHALTGRERAGAAARVARQAAKPQLTKDRQ